MFSYGIYERWDASSKSVPKIKKYTTEIPAEIDIEFGYVLKINKAKGKKLHYTIKHPPFNDKFGKPAGDFTGIEHINKNIYEFYLGDTIWHPIEDKCGDWTLICKLDGREIARKTFKITNTDQPE